MKYKGVVLGLLFAAMAGAAVPAGTASQEEIIYKTKDGLELHGWLTRSSRAQKAPLVLALPMRGSTHKSYDGLIEKLNLMKEDSSWSRPYILAFDLRGHGKSTSLDSKSLSFRNMNPEEYHKIPNDVAAFTRWLLEDTTLKIDTTKIIVIGASIGANSAGILTGLLPGLWKAFMLSPSLDYFGLKPAEALRNYSGQAFILVSKDDRTAYYGSQELIKLNDKHISMKAYDGGAHGTDIINGDKEAMDWLINQVATK